MTKVIVRCLQRRNLIYVAMLKEAKMSIGVQRNTDTLARCAAIAVGIWLVAAANVTFAQSLGPLTQVSGATPFGPLTACGSNPGNPPGANFLNSEAEPWIVVNPVNRENVAVMWLQDIWTNGATRGHVVGTSLDGGVTWQLVPVPLLGKCTGGRFDRVVDPWLSFAPDGTLHQISLVFDIDPPANRTGGLGNNALLVSKSTDGGLTWSNPVSLIEDGNGVLNDKPSLTADPTDSNYVYSVWQRFETAKAAVVSPPNPGLLRPFGLGFTGRFYFARSTDGGDSWTPARGIYNPGANNSTVGHQILVLPDGTLAAFFVEFLSFRNDDGGAPFDASLALMFSRDKGATWHPKGRPIRFARVGSFDLFTPDEGLPVFGGIFDVAVDRSNGTLYAVWQDLRFTGTEAIAFSMSSDGGFTWTEPIKVNQTPSAVPLARQRAFLPSVAVNADGVVGVTYYDFRNDDAVAELTDYFGVQCPNACGDPASWTGRELRLTDISFDIRQAPFASGTTAGLFVGDYEGLAADGSDFVAGFAMPHGGDPDSIFFRRFGH